MKRCCKCKLTKSLTEYNKNKSRKDGLENRCKECFKQNYNNNIDKIKNRHKKYYIENVNKIKKQRVDNADKVNLCMRNYSSSWKGKFAHWRCGARTRKIPWELTLEDLKKIPLICYYTGVELKLERNSPYTASLDRIDSSKGYTKDNVVFCCVFINHMKHSLTIDQFINACNMVIQYQPNKIINEHNSGSCICQPMKNEI